MYYLYCPVLVWNLVSVVMKGPRLSGFVEKQVAEENIMFVNGREGG